MYQGSKPGLFKQGARIGCENCDVTHEPFRCDVDEDEAGIIAGAYENYDFDSHEEEEEMDWIMQNNKFQRYIEDLVKKRLAEELIKLKGDAQKRNVSKTLSSSTMDVTKK